MIVISLTMAGEGLLHNDHCMLTHKNTKCMIVVSLILIVNGSFYDEHCMLTQAQSHDLS